MSQWRGEISLPFFYSSLISVGNIRLAMNREEDCPPTLSRCSDLWRRCAFVCGVVHIWYMMRVLYAWYVCLMWVMMWIMGYVDIYIVCSDYVY